jgi:hypothetical protein
MSELHHPRRASGNRSRFAHLQMGTVEATVPNQPQGQPTTPYAGDRQLEQHGHPAAAR